ncbi:bifunctional 4-hydroxy-2-oxoglutarate aldolase/2-dehydro-3-deoxy-phosphogluconate aldolase [Leptolyngbya sp. PCC 6406]|uniref:bifunctional 4-hydroxy-2-oxoglutarate aldolase/2-dehydro-3-deoxy-phosphogluconate aldolase n=1 Tax=Leptolyngbya sp. PCC 6406 TaxID=1173264 RepID=UPI0002ACA420|nr:bifunctional 4-hydroxy-2-oxoglutarate aldolase/2-dehydro-3-deoxy-phosphogluconate aldolase [Leptolyngbya sp. PCC 6406]
MEAQEWIALLQRHRAIAVIRAPTLALGIDLAEAVAAGGIRLIEITWTSDCPAALITHLRNGLSHCCIGAGTLLHASDMEAAIAAGAQFGFMPHTQPELMQIAQAQGIPAIPGALTPTEIVTAWQAGAPAVKVFPVTALGGAAYLRQLQGPLGHIPLIPTGGVTAANASFFLAAGAIGLGVSTTLFPQVAVEAEDWAAITQRTRDFLASALSIND